MTCFAEGQRLTLARPLTAWVWEETTFPAGVVVYVRRICCKGILLCDADGRPLCRVSEAVLRAATEKSPA